MFMFQLQSKIIGPINIYNRGGQTMPRNNLFCGRRKPQTNNFKNINFFLLAISDFYVRKLRKSGQIQNDDFF